MLKIEIFNSSLNVMNTISPILPFSELVLVRRTDINSFHVQIYHRYSLSFMTKVIKCIQVYTSRDMIIKYVIRDKHDNTIKTNIGLASNEVQVQKRKTT